MHRLFALTLIASLAFVGCGGSSDDAAPTGGPVSEEEIRMTLEGVLNAALNGDASAFSAYLASSCEGREDLTQGVGLLRSLLGGLVPQGELSVRLPEVEYDVVDATHVAVTGLPGLELLVDDQPVEAGVATGIANVWEVAQHVRGEGGPRQIEGATVGLAHVIGLGSACGIHILEKSGLAA